MPTFILNVGSMSDLIRADINLPEMDGYEVAAGKRRIPALADVPVVALTANVLRGDRERSLYRWPLGGEAADG